MIKTYKPEPLTSTPKTGEKKKQVKRRWTYIGPYDCIAAYDHDGNLVGKFRTVQEVADYFELAPKTIYRRLKEPHRAYTKRGKFDGFFRILPIDDSFLFSISHNDETLIDYSFEEIEAAQLKNIGGNNENGGTNENKKA